MPLVQFYAARIAGLALALAIVPGTFAAAPAETFPSRAIKIIVGPSPDVFSRIVAEHLQQTWGQPVVIEPRP
jgi:tripartite-type tricarboxylate transporter receptor subunit TctC